MKFKGLISLGLVLFLLCVPVTKVHAADYQVSSTSNIGTVVVEAPVFNIPDLNDKIIAAIPVGTPIAITGVTNNGWYQVRVSDGTFFIPQGFLDLGEINKGATPTYVSPVLQNKIEYNVMSFNEGVNAINDGLRKHANEIILNTNDYELQTRLYNYFKALLRSSDIKTYAQGNMVGYKTTNTGIYKDNVFYGKLNCYISYSDTIAEENYTELTVKALVPEMLKAGSTVNQVKMVHDYICNITDYDWLYEKNETGYLYCSAYDCLVNNKSLCSGYALFFQKFMEQMNIPSFYVADDVHAWNIVCIDGVWYQIDCTWDGEYSITKDTYFLFGKDAKHNYQASIPVSDKAYSKRKNK